MGENLYKEVIIKIYVGRLNLILSVHPIGFIDFTLSQKYTNLVTLAVQ